MIEKLEFKNPKGYDAGRIDPGTSIKDVVEKLNELIEDNHSLHQRLEKLEARLEPLEDNVYKF